MNWPTFRHNYIWGKNRNWVGEIGLFLFTAGRKLIKWSGKYCSYCGRDPGFDSSYSRKGLRCQKHMNEEV